MKPLPLFLLALPLTASADLLEDAAEWSAIPPTVAYSDTGPEDPDQPNGFDMLSRIDASLEFSNQVWRGNVGLAEFRQSFDGEVVRRGWYMIEQSEKNGHILWMTSTDKNPAGRYAAELAHGTNLTVSWIGASQPGFIETNPLKLGGVGVLKLAFIVGLKRTSGKTCYEGIGIVTAGGWAFTAADMATLSGASPALAAVGAAAGAAGGRPTHNKKFWACAPRP